MERKNNNLQMIINDIRTRSSIQTWINKLFNRAFMCNVLTFMSVWFWCVTLISIQLKQYSRTSKLSQMFFTLHSPAYSCGTGWSASFRSGWKLTHKQVTLDHILSTCSRNWKSFIYKWNYGVLGCWHIWHPDRMGIDKLVEKDILYWIYTQFFLSSMQALTA